MGGAAVRLGVFFAAIILLATHALAFDAADLAVAQQRVEAIKGQLQASQTAIASTTITDEQLATQRSVVERLRQDASQGRTSLAEPLNAAQRRLDSLGPAPQEGQQEASAIAEERRTLTEQASLIAAASKQFELAELDADQTLQRILSVQRAQFLQRIFKSDRTVINPLLWADFATGVGLLWTRVAGQPFTVAGGFNPGGFVLLAIGLAALVGVRLAVLPWIAAKAGYVRPEIAKGELEPSLLRLWRVCWGMLAYGLTGVFVALLVVAALAGANSLSSSTEAFLNALVAATLNTGFYAWIAYLISQPFHPERRLIAVDSGAARVLVVAIAAAAAAYSFGNEFITLADKIFLPVGFIVGQSAASVIVMVAFMALALLLLRKQAAENLSVGQSYFLVWFLRLVPLLWLLLSVSLGALFLGYVSLAYFVAGNLLDTAMLAAGLGALHAFLHGLALSAASPDTRVGRALRAAGRFGEESVHRLIVTFRTLADLLIVLIAITSLMAMWTVTLVDFRSVIAGALEGFSIGNIHISPSMIAVALSVLAIGIVLTRIVTNWLQQRVLDETSLDKGVQASLKTGAGYVGYTLAAALGLSAAGLDFSTLALAAGALGVGVGLGLQPIVNNFVSGLILLAERPVRVGDWIVAPGGEGIVKKISVRATEVETFDSSSIIIPNSTLITNAVRNWTLRDTTGRFTVAVSFIHGIDVETTVAKLQSLAAAHSKVMRHPAPTALLVKIGPQSLDFELGGQVADALEGAAVASDLRLSIAKAFDKKQLNIGPAKAQA